jgi:hypothetical protein
MYVFVVLATHVSENTVMTEVRGVFTHVIEAMPYATALRGEGHLVRVQKHKVYSAGPVLKFGQTQPAFPEVPERGVQTVPQSDAPVPFQGAR